MTTAPHTDPKLAELSDAQRHELAQKMIEEETAKQPLVSDVEPIEVLEFEYKNNPGFLQRIKWLRDEAQFLGLRRVRGDGNCFYRIFGFTYLLTILKMDDRPLHHFTMKHLESTLELLKQQHFDEEIVKDFYAPFADLMSRMHTTDPDIQVLSEKTLVQAFNDPEKSNSVVVYLRLLTSAYLKMYADDYAPFLASDDRSDPPSMQQFCSEEVEALGKDADHLQITALCNALKVSLDVVYLSSAHAPPETDQPQEGETGASHLISEDKPQSSGESAACEVVRFDLEQGQMFGVGPLLYRPGHFDLLVSKAEPETPDVDVGATS